jgi:hypothetical protein
LNRYRKVEAIPYLCGALTKYFHAITAGYLHTLQKAAASFHAVQTNTQLLWRA